jgi:hypothetical protein
MPAGLTQLGAAGYLEDVLACCFHAILLLKKSLNTSGFLMLGKLTQQSRTGYIRLGESSSFHIVSLFLIKKASLISEAF